MAVARFERRVLIAERLTHTTSTGFDEVLGNLRASTPRIALEQIVELSWLATDATEFARLIETRFSGASGFYLYAELHYAHWMHRLGVDRRVVRMVLGNPMITATMMREDVTSGLFSPIEIILVEAEDGRGCSIVHMKPSSLIAVEPDAALLSAAAEGLDQHILKLIRSVTAEADLPS